MYAYVRMGASLDITHFLANLINMSRPLRLNFPSAIYHLTSRGNARAAIYLDDDDKQRFLDLLKSCVEKFNWICHSYCLMDNHYHLLIETPDANLQAGMRQLNGVYTQQFNRKHGRVGHVFQGRYKAILIDKDSYLLELCRYVVLNPVRAKMVALPDQYHWSSFPVTMGTHKGSSCASAEWILSQFSSRKRYQQFVLEGIGQTSHGANSKDRCSWVVRILLKLCALIFKMQKN